MDKDIMLNNLRYIFRYYRSEVMKATDFSERDLERIAAGEVFIAPRDLRKIAAVVGATMKEMLYDNLDRTTPNPTFHTVKVGEFFMCRYGDSLYLKISMEDENNAFDFTEGKVVSLSRYNTQVRRVGMAKVVSW